MVPEKSQLIPVELQDSELIFDPEHRKYSQLQLWDGQDRLISSYPHTSNGKLRFTNPGGWYINPKDLVQGASENLKLTSLVGTRPKEFIIGIDIYCFSSNLCWENEANRTVCLKITHGRAIVPLEKLSLKMKDIAIKHLNCRLSDDYIDSEHANHTIALLLHNDEQKEAHSQKLLEAYQNIHERVVGEGNSLRFTFESDIPLSLLPYDLISVKAVLPANLSHRNYNIVLQFDTLASSITDLVELFHWDKSLEDTVEIGIPVEVDDLDDRIGVSLSGISTGATKLVKPVIKSTSNALKKLPDAAKNAGKVVTKGLNKIKDNPTVKKIVLKKIPKVLGRATEEAVVVGTTTFSSTMAAGLADKITRTKSDEGSSSQTVEETVEQTQESTETPEAS